MLNDYKETQNDHMETPNDHNVCCCFVTLSLRVSYVNCGGAFYVKICYIGIDVPFDQRMSFHLTYYTEILHEEEEHSTVVRKRANGSGE